MTPKTVLSTILIVTMLLMNTVVLASNNMSSIGDIGYMNEPDTAGLDHDLQFAISDTQTVEGKMLPGIFSFDSFIKNPNYHTDWLNDFVYVDGDSVELVIGLDGARFDSYAKVVDIIVENEGKIVNTILIGDAPIAIVADLPFYAVSSFVTQIHANDFARYVEPNMKFETSSVPNDLYWNLQWGPQKIKADWAWNTTKGDSAVLVAVIDTGVDYDHPDLAANYVPLGRDWVNNDNDPMDDHGHGTHCAGIIAALINNSLGIAGIADVSIMAEKGLDSYGSGYEDQLADAIIHAVDQGATILSNSWGGYGESALIHDAVKYAYDNGVLVVAAAGNEAWSNKLYPAAYDEVIAVTATDSYDSPASFTNFGDWIEVAAPGVNIYSTIWDNFYDYMSGTSMACPHVAGVAALIWSQFPNVTRDWVRAQLRFTADDLGDPSFDEYYGYGRVNAKKAVENAPSDHDLLIYDLKRPEHIEPGDIVTLSAAVLNFGLSDEQNITVELFVDGNQTNSTIISYLAQSSSTMVNFSWNPLIEHIYNVTFHIVPVPGEALTDNNVMTDMISVIYALGFILFDQTRCYPIIYCSTLVEELTDRGYIIDTYTAGIITPEVLADYDIFVILQAWSSYFSSEISAIQNFVLQGGGLLVLGDDYPSVYNTLTDFAGITWSSYARWSGGYTSDITPHEVTKGVATAYFGSPYSPLLISSPATELIRDGAGYGDIILAVSDLGAGRVIGIGDENSIDDMSIMNSHNLALANNMMDWLLGEKYEHDLVASLDAPKYLAPDEATILNATVYNWGLNNETNVELMLFINDTIADSATIPELVNGTAYTINHPWTPPMNGTYNVTVYIPPVSGENVTLNNIKTTLVSVHPPLIDPVEGQYANYTMHYYDSSGNIIGVGYWNITYDYYVEPHKIYVTIWLKDPSGYISTGWMIVNTMNRFVESGMWVGLWFPGWIETNIELGSEINLLDGAAIVNGSRIVPVNLYPIDCWELLIGGYGYDYTFLYDKTSGLWISYGYFDPYYYQTFELILTDTNIPIGTTYEHELAVTLDAPSFLEPNDTSLLNATVYNLGLSTEENVKLLFLINGTEVKSTIIPTLLNGTSSSINYLWTPTLEATCNITAYAQPVAGENVAINNVAAKLVRVRPIIGYVLFDQTHYADSMLNYGIWVTSLNNRGYVVDTLTKSPITQAMLNSYDVFVIPQAHGYYSSDELLAIKNYVLNGGGLLVFGDDYLSVYTDITNFAGMTWDWGGYSGYLTDITPHPVTEGVAVVCFGSPGLIRVKFPAQDIIRDQYGNAIIVISEVGLGAVIGMADENSIDNNYITVSDNKRLANNMVDWLTSRRPIASFTYSPLDPFVGEIVTFDASESYDPDGTIESYLWNFGDNASAIGDIATHTFVAGGTYNVTLTVVDSQGLDSTAETQITVQRTTLNVQTKVGSIHFRGETAEFYILVSSLGKPVDATIEATLYYNGNPYDNLSDNVEHVSLGLCRIPHEISLDASAGTYALVVKATYLTLEGTALESFLLSATLTGWNAALVNINGTVGTIKTDVGTIAIKLDTIHATLLDIEDRTATINSTIGLIQADIDLLNMKVTAINGTIATIQTTFGTFAGRITSIEEDIATIETDVGTVKLDIGSLKEGQQAFTIPIYILVVPVLIIAIGTILVAYFTRKKSS